MAEARGLAARLVVRDELVARVAAWPIEALDPFAAPALADQARALAEAEAAVAARAAPRIAALHAAVVQVPERRARAWLLTVKRTLHAGLAPWREPGPAEAAAIEASVPGLLGDLSGELTARRALAIARASLAGAHARALAEQRRALAELADDPRLLRALLIANPELAATWRRYRARPEARRGRVRRMEDAILGYVLRAVGRATPSAGWAGATRVLPGASEGALAVRPALPRTVVAPDLGPFRDAVAALARRPHYREGYPLRLDPAAHRDAEGWRGPDEGGFIRLPDGPLVSVIAEAYADGRPRPLAPLVEFLVERAGNPGLRALLHDAAAQLLAAGVLRSALAFPAAPAGPWEALDAVTPQLREPERAAWSACVERCRRLCAALAADFDELPVARLEQALAAARAAVAELHAALGVSLPLPGQLLRVDRGPPFELRASPALHAALRRAALAVLACHARAGAAEAFRRAIVGDAPGRQPLLAGLLAQAGRAGQARAAGDAAWEAWAARLPVDPGATRLDLALPPDLDARPGPWGSMGFALPGEGPPVLCWARPQPGLAACRLGELLPETAAADPVARAWLERGVAPIEVVGVDADNASATVRRPAGAREIGRHEASAAPLAAVALAVDDRQRPWLLLPDSPERFVPVYSASASVGLRDPISRGLLRLTMAHGWEYVSFGFPAPAAWRAPGRTIPRVVAGGAAVVGPRRWIFTRDQVDRLCAAEGARRYALWRAEVEARAIGAWIWLGPLEALEHAPLLVRTDSPLIVEAALDRLAAHPGDLVAAELPGDPTRWPVQDAAGRHYLCELALTWVDPGVWDDLPEETSPELAARIDRTEETPPEEARIA